MVLIFFFSNEAEEEGQSNLKKIGDSIISSAFQESLHMVDRAIFNTMKGNHNQGTVQSPVQILSFFKQAEPETQEISRAAELLETTLHILKSRTPKRNKRTIMIKDHLSMKDLKLIANLSGCLPYMQPPICPNGCLARKYRTISGACNNRNHSQWGAASTALARWLPAEYEDGRNQPKGWNAGLLYNGFPLPPVRDVSNNIMQTSNDQIVEDDSYSQMIVDWGQYIDHDISFTPQTTSKASFVEGVDCQNTCENLNPCFPIKIPPNDSFSGTRDCLPFFRSSPACFTGDEAVLFEDLKMLPQRQQMNALSSFLDASTVYGNSPSMVSKLRNFSSQEGLLAVNTKFTDSGRSYLPFVSKTPSPCAQDPRDAGGERIECFMAGDTRSSEVISLSVLHTLWVREHNRIAKALKKLNHHWTAETTYQETRKIIGALHQIITFRDYVPKILGADAFDQYIGVYGGYDSSLNPTVSNVFATAAFRFGHATVSPVTHRLDEKYQEHNNFSSVSLHETFFSPWRLIKEGGLDPVIRGLMVNPAVVVTPDHLMNEELTKKLFVLSSPGALDLASLNLQRGRDHGLPGYNAWRKFCGFPTLESQADLHTVISNASIVQRIMDVYGHPSNIDVWLGGLVEDILPGARTGPLFACLIGKQMKMLQEGDWFWWENSGVFTQTQREEFEKHSLSRVICDNSGVTEVSLDPFRLGRYPEDFFPCDQIPGMNLDAWQENLNEERTQCGSPTKIEHGDFVFCSSPGKLVVMYSCYFGYRLEGAEEIFCTENGWSGDPPLCKDSGMLTKGYFVNIVMALIAFISLVSLIAA
nr:PREDICTED: thyroid peroxidase [Lepisosteus oculatus]